MSFPIPLPTLRAAFIALVMGLPAKVYDALRRDHARAPLVAAMSAKVYALVRRFAAIAVHVHNGTLRQPPRRRAGGTRRVASPRQPSLLPRRFGWLGHMTWETGFFTEGLDRMVRTDLEMVALLTAAPQAKPILRSLFWMLGRKLPDILRPAKRAPRPPKVRAAVPAPEPGLLGTGRHPYRPSANWPKGCVTRPPRRRAKPRTPAKPQATAGPPAKD